MWFLFSLVALLCWSGSDVWTKVGSRPEDKNSQFKAVVAVGFVMGLHALFEIFVSKVPISWQAIVSYLPASLLYIFSMVLGYVGLRYIELSVSSPICNCSGGLVTLLCVIFLKETLDAWQIVAVCAIVVGVVGLAYVEATEDEQLRALRQSQSNVKYSKSFLALLFPLLYCALDAAGTFADAVILENLSESTANVAYELTFAFMAIVALIILIVRRGKVEVKKDWAFGAGAVCETAGQLAYIYALADKAVVAAPVISCYCVLSVVWSRIFLKEKLSVKHYVAISIAVLGIVILGIYDGLTE